MLAEGSGGDETRGSVTAGTDRAFEDVRVRRFFRIGRKHAAQTFIAQKRRKNDPLPHVDLRFC